MSQWYGEGEDILEVQCGGKPGGWSEVAAHFDFFVPAAARPATEAPRSSAAGQRMEALPAFAAMDADDGDGSGSDEQEAASTSSGAGGQVLPPPGDAELRRALKRGASGEELAGQ